MSELGNFLFIPVVISGKYHHIHVCSRNAALAMAGNFGAFHVLFELSVISPYHFDLHRTGWVNLKPHYGDV